MLPWTAHKNIRIGASTDGLVTTGRSTRIRTGTRRTPVNEAIADLTGAWPKLEERTQLAAEVALRDFPARQAPYLLLSALDRAWRWAALRGVPLSGRAPLDLLSEAIRELVQSGDNVGPATAELATLASYHLVGGVPSC